MGNVTVLNDTGDFYRFFDATPHAEFLYACVRKTIEEDLPNETNFLRNFDQFRARIENIVDMPEHTLNNLFGFLRQNGGQLSKRAREMNFSADGSRDYADRAIVPRYFLRDGSLIATNELRATSAIPITVDVDRSPGRRVCESVTAAGARQE